MSRRKKEKKKWRFFWKNICALGRLNRLIAGAALLYAAYMMKEDELIAAGLAGWAGAFIFDGLMGWSVWRAILKRPSRCAYRKRYPEEAGA